MMKKEENFPEVIFTDEKFVIEMTSEIKAAKVEFQKLLDLWNDANLKPIETYKELFRLMYDPAGVYKLSDRSDILPENIMVQSRVCRGIGHNGRLDIWAIEDSKTVLINETELQRFTHVNDIVVHNEAQAQFARDVVQYVELSNSINTTLMALPTTHMPAVPFSKTGAFFPIICTLKLETELLQEILKAL